MASLTKVVATTTAAMILEEQGLLDLDRTVASYLPEFNAPDKAAITRADAHHAPRRTRGVRAAVPGIQGTRAVSRTDQHTSAQVAAGHRDCLQRLGPDSASARDRETHEPDARPVRRRKGFHAARNDRARCSIRTALTLFARIAPTEIDSVRGGLVRGKVHDENAWAIGGVSGHAGLFSTARDLTVFAQMLLNGGEYNGCSHRQAGDSCALDGAAIANIEPRARLGHAVEGIECRQLFLAAQLRAYRIYGNIDLDRSGEESLRDSADQPGKSDERQQSSRATSPRRR